MPCFADPHIRIACIYGRRLVPNANRSPYAWPCIRNEILHVTRARARWKEWPIVSLAALSDQALDASLEQVRGIRMAQGVHAGDVVVFGRVEGWGGGVSQISRANVRVQAMQPVVSRV
jgi:hypothetical protein